MCQCLYSLVCMMTSFVHSSHDGGRRAAVRRGIPLRIRHGRRPLIYISFKLLVFRSATRDHIVGKSMKIIKFASCRVFDIVGQHPRDNDDCTRNETCVSYPINAWCISHTCSRVEKRFVLHLPFIPQYFVRVVSILYIQLYWILVGNSTKSEYWRYNCTSEVAVFLVICALISEAT